MIALEITLLVVAYTLLIITIFVEIICYQRNLETLETIGFSISLLLLIVAFTVSPFWGETIASASTNVFSLLAMVLVGLMTPLNIWRERKHYINPAWKKGLIGFSTLLFLLVVIGYFIGLLPVLQYVVVIFLGTSVILSMVVLRRTQPRAMVRHREKAERIFAIAFIILIPLSLMVNYVEGWGPARLKIGFTIPLVFIFLAAHKLWDDLQRLSFFSPATNVKEQNLKNYGLTKREQEITMLLVRGTTYKQISEELFIALPTVKTHVTNIYRKCKVKNKVELIALLIN